MIVINKRPYQLKNSAVCIGKFDGLHRGHQSLIEEIARFSDCNKVLFTFAFSKAPYILSPEEKRTKAEKLGIDTYVECPFDDALKAMKFADFSVWSEARFSGMVKTALTLAVTTTLKELTP